MLEESGQGRADPIECRFALKIFGKGERVMGLNIVEKIDGPVSVKHALVSCSDKANIEELVKGLLDANPEMVIFSTGGTYRMIESLMTDSQRKDNLVAVSEYTGQPEMQGGLVKTLDFKIYLGLLSETYNDAHCRDLDRVGGVAIDMVVANLYPFKQTVAGANVTPEMARTNIDIGGPCMVRAAAKNYLRVAAVTDPADYEAVTRELRVEGARLSLQTRFRLAKKAFRHTAEYDKAIADYFESIDFGDVEECYEEVRKAES
jgi:phosphoribosylaminoimidazolecarboxamide formyltransferase/IMP cyclohydrolase